MPFARHQQNLRTVPMQYRPEVRWWLAEGLHTDRTLTTEVDAIHRLGFGGLEFLAMDEPGIDRARYSWGSEEWIHDSHVIVDRATDLGLGVSFTSGTNWANANLNNIDADHPAASQELNVVTEDIDGRKTRTGALRRASLDADRPGGHAPTKRIPATAQHLVAVVAAPILAENGDRTQLAAGETIDLTSRVHDGELDWTSPDKRVWRLFTFWRHGTGQIAEPSMTANYTVNYLDPDGAAAVIEYWDRTVLTPELRALLTQNPQPQLYMDSLELFTWGEGGMFWGRTVHDEFLRRRGYDITPWLPFLTRVVTNFAASTLYCNEPDDAHAATVSKVRNDYVTTLTDLYIDNMLRPLREFLHRNGMTLRAEVSYGMPFELSRPGAEVDGVENESLEFGAQIDAYRMLSGVAHLLGKPYSSETGATTRNHMLDHRFYDQIVATQFASGVSRTVLHGWASMAGAEGLTHWPGHEGMYSMFSERFDLRQPAAEFYPLWNEAMGRIQYLLRQGRPRVDVGILRTDHFIDNLCGLHLLEDGVRVPDEDMYGSRWMRARDNHWWRDLSMQDAGVTYEFLDGTLLLRDDVHFAEGTVQPAGPGYQALVVYQEELDADVAALLLAWAKEGLPVVLVDGASELVLLSEDRYTTHHRAASRTPGLDGRDDELRRLISELAALPTTVRATDPAETVNALGTLGVVGRAQFTVTNESVLTHLRDDDDLLHLFAYNYLYETGTTTDVEIRFPAVGGVQRLDHWTGEFHADLETRTDGNATYVRLTLAPGEFVMLTLDRGAAHVPARQPRRSVVADLDRWDLTVRSWEAGDTEIISEDRGLGYITREALPHTREQLIHAGIGPLTSWDAHPSVGADISGVGDYYADVNIDDVTDGDTYVLDLGSTCGGLGALSVNGHAWIGFDTSHPCVDVTGCLRPGSNTIHVSVSTSLNNRLVADGYYLTLPDAFDELGEHKMTGQTPPIRQYGLVGPVQLTKVERAKD